MYPQIGGKQRLTIKGECSVGTEKTQSASLGAWVCPRVANPFRVIPGAAGIGLWRCPGRGTIARLPAGGCGMWETPYGGVFHISTRLLDTIYLLLLHNYLLCATGITWLLAEKCNRDNMKGATGITWQIVSFTKTSNRNQNNIRKQLTYKEKKCNVYFIKFRLHF